MRFSGRCSHPLNIEKQRRLARLRELLDSPVATYYLLLSATTLLTMIGLVMVLSASMIVSKISYEVTDPTIDSQMVSPKATGADTFFNIT